MLDIGVPNVESARMRHATKDWLSLALIDARNHSLRWISACEKGLGGAALAVPLRPEIDPPLWTLGHIGWFQERWIGRNVQRDRGDAGDSTQPRLASILPNADAWYDSAHVPHADRWALPLPDLQATKHYLVETLETTLDLLGHARDDDASLYFYRLALFHEDLHIEALAVLAQTLGFDPGLLPPMTGMAIRSPLSFPASHWPLGSAAGGFAFDNERPRHEVAVPEFEIDSQVVAWAHFCEFVEDGAYDEPRFWSEAGWRWLQAEGRRTPRHVDQMRQGVLQRRFGRLARVPLNQPAVHVSWYEADAWCRWAGRRLPTEVEWELAAVEGASRGFRWGDVWEWTATTFRPYPGFVAGPDRTWSEPAFGRDKVLRGASFATPGRLRHPTLRNFHPPQTDAEFCGFRSCAN